MLSLMVPGSAPPVDVFPVLKYVPEFLAKWKTEARRVRDLFVEDAWMWFNNGKKQYARIQEDPESVPFEGFIAKLLRERDETPDAKGGSFNDLELGYIGQAMIGAAMDTTSATFESLMCAFAAFPETLRLAQDEVDRVVGTERPPTGEDINNLPYLKACVSEVSLHLHIRCSKKHSCRKVTKDDDPNEQVLRWRPTTPVALPHTLAKDDRFGDYLFPKGTTFIANAWGIHRNEDDYERPDEFLPERFLKHPYGLKPGASTEGELQGSGRRSLYAFGSGRRQCPGEQFAFTTILLAASKVVWAFNVQPPEGGIDVSIETGYKDGVVTVPINPTLRLTLRDPSRKNGLQEDFDTTQSAAKKILGNL